MRISGTKGENVCQHLETFKIKKSVYLEMIDFCRTNLPFEACGLLSGTEGMGRTLWKLKNESRSPNRFSMSKESIQQAVNEMEVKGEQLIGIFHSHPSTPAFPSSHDIKNNPYTDLAYIIVSFYKGKIEVGCFKTDGKTAIPLHLIVVDQ
jgi:proteasome lid subunit RPN8/RPN11